MCAMSAPLRIAGIRRWSATINVLVPERVLSMSAHSRTESNGAVASDAINTDKSTAFASLVYTLCSQQRQTRRL
jgi:hypothetical protein